MYAWQYTAFRWLWTKPGSEPAASLRIAKFLLFPKWLYFKDNYVTKIVLENNTLSNAYNTGLAQKNNLIRNEKGGTYWSQMFFIQILSIYICIFPFHI